MKAPRGLGASVEIIEKLIAGNEAAMLAWDRAVRGEHGGAHNPLGLGGESKKTAQDVVNVDNIHVDCSLGTVRPTGTSAQSGLRRLEKAATSGNGNAASLLRKVLDPADPTSINGACVQLV